CPRPGTLGNRWSISTSPTGVCMGAYERRSIDFGAAQLFWGVRRLLFAINGDLRDKAKIDREPDYRTQPDNGDVSSLSSGHCRTALHPVGPCSSWLPVVVEATHGQASQIGDGWKRTPREMPSMASSSGHGTRATRLLSWLFREVSSGAPGA